MKNFTLGDLWYNAVQTIPKTLEYFILDTSEVGRLIEWDKMDDFVEKYSKYGVRTFEIDFSRSLLYVQIENVSYRE